MLLLLLLCCWLQEELYGAAVSSLFPGLRWGGMTADTAVFLQSALNMTVSERERESTLQILLLLPYVLDIFPFNSSFISTISILLFLLL